MLPASKIISISALNDLIKKIQGEILEGKQRAEIAIENEKTITYWKIGRHIDNHLLEHQDRAEYGQELMKNLAEKLGLRKSTLYQSVNFYKEYPNIFQAPGKLGWTHYILLLTVKSEEKREELEQRVIEENLSTRELKKIIDKYKKPNNNHENTDYPVERGIPYTYKIKNLNIEKKSVLQVDCGFKFFNKNIEKEILKYKEGTIIQSLKKNGKYSVSQSNNNESKLFTYKAYIKQIIDGDTAWMSIDLGFNNWTLQKLRLRNINAPDLITPEGQKVKKYISSRLNSCEFLIIRTHCRDKFTRYLADIFYDKNITDEYELAEKGKLLNLELLEKGLVGRY